MSRLPLLALVASLALAVVPLAHAEHEPTVVVVQSDQYRSDRYGDQPPRDYRQDRVLQYRVHDAIDGALGRDARRIRVEVRRGHVLLKGKVHDARTRALAYRVAHEVPGVRGVSVRRLYASRW